MKKSTKTTNTRLAFRTFFKENRLKHPSPHNSNSDSQIQPKLSTGNCKKYNVKQSTHIQFKQSRLEIVLFFLKKKSIWVFSAVFLCAVWQKGIECDSVECVFSLSLDCVCVRYTKFIHLNQPKTTFAFAKCIHTALAAAVCSQWNFRRNNLGPHTHLWKEWTNSEKNIQFPILSLYAVIGSLK